MAESDLINAFDDCIDRLAAGQSIDDCLRLYPQYAAALRPMLEAGRVVQRARVSAAEIAQAQDRVRQQFREAMQSPVAQPPLALRRLMPLAASVMLIILALSGGAAALAQDSLPGDTLYGVKRLTEDLRLALSSDDMALKQEYAARRVDEIRQVLALGRPTDVNFSGVVTSIANSTWMVAGLPLRVLAGTPGAESIQPDTQVEVQAYTTAQGELIAVNIQPVASANEAIIPLTGTLAVVTYTPTNTPAPALTATSTTAPTNTLTVTATITPTPIATMLVTASRTPRPTATARASATPLPTTAVTVSAPSGACSPNPPAGWVSYSVRAGDTLSALASGSSASLQEIIAVNCLTNTRIIVVGQLLYLPQQPQVRATEEDSSGSGSGSGDDSGGNSGRGGGSGGDDDGDDDHGRDDDSSDDD